MKKFLKENVWVMVGVIIGGLAGYLYWRYVGCMTGTCSITSKPLNSTLYGIVMGGLAFSIFKKDKKQST
jgi:hypothetical protein